MRTYQVDRAQRLHNNPGCGQRAAILRMYEGLSVCLLALIHAPEFTGLQRVKHYCATTQARAPSMLLIVQTPKGLAGLGGHAF